MFWRYVLAQNYAACNFGASNFGACNFGASNFAASNFAACNLMQLCGTSIIEVIVPMSNEIHFGHAYSYAGVPYKLFSIPSLGLSYLATYDALCIFVHIVT